MDTDDYVLLDADGPAPNVTHRGSLTAAAQGLRSDPSFEVLLDDAGVILAKRIPR
jgi:hypothetical protein